MRSIRFCLFQGILFLAISANANMVVHEWGTFTSLVGSNGVTQNGMYHEDERLPDFVHGFGYVRALEAEASQGLSFSAQCRGGKGCISEDYLTQNIITQKMETPVIYFYTDQEQSLEINIEFPEGVITETYPAPVQTFPTALSAPILANGNTTFKVKILPTIEGDIPLVEPGNIYAHARNVASNLVVSANEQEKFIFYRGLGRFQPRISITSNQGNLSLKAPNPADKALAAFLVHVDGSGQGQMINLGAFSDHVVSATQIAQLSNHSGEARSAPSILSSEKARATLVSALKEAGLFNDEALAMVNTWENGYLKVPGLRLLYVLPAKEVDAVLPLCVTPAPNNLTRVFVGRIEILLDTDEQRIRDEILTQRENFDVTSLGRFAEPILRRVTETYVGSEAAVKDLFTDLIGQASL